MRRLTAGAAPRLRLSESVHGFGNLKVPGQNRPYGIPTLLRVPDGVVNGQPRSDIHFPLVGDACADPTATAPFNSASAYSDPTYHLADAIHLTRRKQDRRSLRLWAPLQYRQSGEQYPINARRHEQMASNRNAQEGSREWGLDGWGLHSE